MTPEKALNLLESIGSQLVQMTKTRAQTRLNGHNPATLDLECLEAVFLRTHSPVNRKKLRQPSPVGSLDLSDAIHALAAGIHYYGDFDLDDADEVEVRSI